MSFGMNGELSPEQAAEQLVGVMVIRAVQRIGGSLVQEHATPAIAAFCSHCDFRDNARVCPRADQGRYVFRDYCGWSSRNGVRLGEVTMETIQFKQETFPRNQLERLDSALASSGQQS